MFSMYRSKYVLRTSEAQLQPIKLLSFPPQVAQTQDSDLFRLGSLHVVIHDNEMWLGSLTVLRGGSPGRLFCGTEVFFDAFPLNRQSNLLSGQ